MISHPSSFRVIQIHQYFNGNEPNHMHMHLLIIIVVFFLKIFLHTYYFSMIVFLVNQTECDERQVLNKGML